MRTESHTMTWQPDRPVDIQATLGPLVRGGQDPTHRVAANGFWRTCRSPEGPATLRIWALGPTQVQLQAWGPGAQWALAQAPDLLGAADQQQGFAPVHEQVRWAWRRRPGWRVPRTQLVLESLIPAIIEQKVTSQEAFGAWRRLIRRFGEPAPGPAASMGLLVVPEAEQWARIASWDWLRAGVDGGRSATAVAAAQRAVRLEESLTMPLDLARQRLRALPGVGEWTAAETLHRAHGDPDALSLGDYHVAKNIGWVLLGRPITDIQLEQLLAPYRPHRYRVQRLLELEFAPRPRRGPRMAPRTHLPR